MGDVTKRLLIRGRVQGVGFRYSMLAEARRLGLGGYVRNRSDGTVEAVAAGEAEAVHGLIAWARKGPPLSDVDRVDVDAADGTFGEFEIRS